MKYFKKFLLLGIVQYFFIFNGLAQFHQPQNSEDSVKVKNEALFLISLPEPVFNSNNRDTTDNKTSDNLNFGHMNKVNSVKFRMRDGAIIYAIHAKKESPRAIIMIHGVGSNSSSFNNLAYDLSEASNSEIYAIDLRGHGKSDGNAGDIDYPDQYLDDISDIISNLKHNKSDNKVILAGHSMGGGLTLMYSQHKELDRVDGYLLLAPQIGQNNPAFRVQPIDTNNADEPFMNLHLSRIAGIYMLNQIGIHKYDSLPVMFLNVDPDARVKNYSYRATVNSTPSDYKTALESVDKNMKVIVGRKDEVFDPEIIEKTVKQLSNGEVNIVEGASHNSLLSDSNSLNLIVDWLKKYF